MTRHPAVFLDRDKTLIEDPGYIDHPDTVRLFDDAADGLKKLRAAGYRIVVVTNQSGVARGMLTEQRLAQVHERLRELLAGCGARLDAIYTCPYLDTPEAKIEAYRRSSDLRKPAPGMLLKAAGDLDLDLARSWMIGDGARDIEAGRRAGCRTILLERAGPDQAARRADPHDTVRSLREAADLICRGDGHGTGEAGPRAADQNPATPSGEEPLSSPQTVRLLSEIRDLLDRGARRRRQQDFSVMRLAATLLQMLAVVAALWGLAALLWDGGAAGARLTLALFLQVAALCALLADRRE